MPSEKRARQRAARQAKQEAQAKVDRRRKTIRNGVIVVVVAAVVVGTVYLISRPKSTPAASKSTTTTTSSATTTTSSSAQAAVNKIAVAAGCPQSPSTRVNTLTWSSAPAMTIDTSKTYTATITTTAGTIVMTLDPATAPVAVNNFVFLANQGYYTCNIFHRVIPQFVDQTGDPTGTGTGSPGYEFTEAGPATASPQYPLGSVAMANSSSGSTDPSTNGSQFFIVAGSEGEALPPDYVLFGQVTSGMSVVNTINAQGTTSGTPAVVQRMLKVTISSS